MADHHEESAPLHQPSPPSTPDQPGLGSILMQKMQSAPCFRGPLMWGLACGFLAGVHKFRIYRTAPRALLQACDFAVISMGISSSLAWWVCMNERKREEWQLRRAMELQGFKPMSELPSEEVNPP